MLYYLSYSRNLEVFFLIFCWFGFDFNICKPESHPLYNTENNGIYLIEVIQGFSKIIWVKSLEE